ncbi:MAG: cytochrome c [Gammaproteobacteria bacterium]
MRHAVMMTVALIGLALAPAAFADGNAELGRTKSASCTACHGPDGRGTAPNYPILAGQHAAYLAHSLYEYRSGRRKNAIMQGFAGGLSDDDIADLAAWFASLEDLKTARF